MILLGSQWTETADLFGMRSLAQAFMIVFSFLNSEAFRSSGKPQLSVLAQAIDLVIAIPVLYWSANRNYDSRAFWSTACCFVLIVATSVIAHFTLGIYMASVIKNVYPSLLSAVVMALTGAYLRILWPGLVWELFTVFICVIVYAGCMYLLPDGRKQLAEVPVLNKILRLT